MFAFYAESLLCNTCYFICHNLRLDAVKNCNFIDLILKCYYRIGVLCGPVVLYDILQPLVLTVLVSRVKWKYFCLCHLLARDKYRQENFCLFDQCRVLWKDVSRVYMLTKWQLIASFSVLLCTQIWSENIRLSEFISFSFIWTLHSIAVVHKFNFVSLTDLEIFNLPFLWTFILLLY